MKNVQSRTLKNNAILIPKQKDKPKVSKQKDKPSENIIYYHTTSAINAFIANKRADKLSENTIRSYEQKLKPFVEFCGENFNLIDKGIIRNFFDWYGKTHKESTTIAIFTNLKIFYNYIENMAADSFDDDEKPFKNPMERLKAPRRTEETIHDPISLEDFKKMIAYSTTCKKGIFYKSILYFLIDTGARAQECLSCDIDSVDLITGEVEIKLGKGRKRRRVFIGPTPRKLLKSYLKTRTDNNPALWLSSYGDRLTYSGLNRILKTVAEGAKIPPPSAHDFRRACIKNLILDNTNPYLVQIYAGWTSSAVLNRYAKLYSDDIRIAHERSGIDNWLKQNR
jgi:site-specific recombinase XerD